jgi:gamma-glutamylputrescine oxidase
LTNRASYAGDGAYPQSWYAASRNDIRQPVALGGEAETDVAIVGAGYTGLSAALHLAERGYKAAIVEGAGIGWGASGRNGGQIVNGLNADLAKIRRWYGTGVADFVGGLLQEGARTIYRIVEQYGIDCDLKRGNLYTAFTAKQMRELADMQEEWRGHGMDDHELLDRDGVRRHIATNVYVGGMLDRSGGQMNPLNLALGEARAFEGLGGTVYEQSPVTAVTREGNGFAVRTDGGFLRARTVLLCGNAYLGHVVPALTARVMPVSTQMIATAPLGAERAARLLPTDICVEDVRYILDYYRRTADDRLLFGGGINYGGSDPADIAASLRPKLRRVFPELADIEIEYAWSGNFALSFSRVPQMGRLEEGLYFAHGYSGHGITGSHLFGRILAEAVDGDLARFDVFAGLRWIPFPGGRALRVPYSTVGAWWYSFRDAIGL